MSAKSQPLPFILIYFLEKSLDLKKKKCFEKPSNKQLSLDPQWLDPGHVLTQLQGRREGKDFNPLARMVEKIKGTRSL